MCNNQVNDSIIQALPIKIESTYIENIIIM